MRQRQIIAVVGASESGKSVLTRFLASKSKQFLVIDPQGAWSSPEKGACRFPLDRNHPNKCFGHFGVSPFQTIALAVRNGFSGTVILDDSDAYLSQRTPVATWGKIWAANRHLGIDVIFVARRPQDLPVQAMTSVKRVFVFKYQETDLAAAYVRSKWPALDNKRLPKDAMFCYDIDPWKDNCAAYLDLRGLIKKGFGNARGY